MIAVIEPRLTALQQIPKGGIGAEIGVFKGDFSEVMLRIVQPQVLHLIDPWLSVDSEQHREAWYSTGQRSQSDMDAIFAGVTTRFARQIEAGRIVIHRAPCESVLRGLPDGSLDWVYIDGDHTEAAVLTDLRLAFRKVRHGGLICGDDYALGGWWGAGVMQATNRFVGEHFTEIAIACVVDSQFVLRKLAKRA